MDHLAILGVYSAKIKAHDSVKHCFLYPIFKTYSRELPNLLLMAVFSFLYCLWPEAVERGQNNFSDLWAALLGHTRSNLRFSFMSGWGGVCFLEISHGTQTSSSLGEERVPPPSPLLSLNRPQILSTAFVPPMLKMVFELHFIHKYFIIQQNLLLVVGRKEKVIFLRSFFFSSSTTNGGKEREAVKEYFSSCLLFPALRTFLLLFPSHRDECFLQHLPSHEPIPTKACGCSAHLH